MEEKATFATRAEALKIVGEWQQLEGGDVGWARTVDGQIAFRNFLDPQGPALLFEHHSVDRFVIGVLEGDFNEMLTVPAGELMSEIHKCGPSAD